MSDGGWVAAKCECRVCAVKHVSVHPEECDEDALECPNCHAMSAEVTHFIDKEGEEVER